VVAILDVEQNTGYMLSAQQTETGLGPQGDRSSPSNRIEFYLVLCGRNSTAICGRQNPWPMANSVAAFCLLRTGFALHPSTFRY